MANKFANGIRNQGLNLTRTENGAVALKSTGSDVLNLFSSVGALRGKSYNEVYDEFALAYAEHRLLAVKTMFYARGIRNNGIGERDTFRFMLKALASINPSAVVKNLGLIAEFGRFDDLYALVCSPCEEEMFAFMKEQLRADLYAMEKGKPVSLLAKWMKSVNTSSKESNTLGKLTAYKLGLSEKSYRQTLSKLRAHIGVVEGKISKNNWDEVNYPSVPSQAMKKLRTAFGKHDPVRFGKFLESVKKGEVTIKASTLFPYDILMAGNLRQVSDGRYAMNSDPVLEAQYLALPNYVNGEFNVIVMSDVSGSMGSDNGVPIATSIGCGIYFAERNKGPFHNMFLTFSEKPTFQELKGRNLSEKVGSLRRVDAMNTNLEAAFDLVLQIAKDNQLETTDMPKAFIIITDMNFDRAVENGLFFRIMKDKFLRSGYEMPEVVFWNCAERAKAYQANRDNRGVLMVSGHSASTFSTILKNLGKDFTPYDLMLEVLNGPAFKEIVL